MVNVSRSAFAEQPNGDLTCTITIPAAQRLAVLGGAGVVLADTPGPDLPVQLPAGAMAAIAFHADSEPFTVELEPADTAAEKPEPQTIGAGGFDTAQVVSAITSGEHAWDHPAAPHMARIFRHDPFQRFAMQRLAADAFAAPMECATRLLMRAVKDKPMDAASVALARTMDEYMAWATSQQLPLWPA